MKKETKYKIERDALSELYDSLVEELEQGLDLSVSADDLLTKLDEYKKHKREVLGETKSTYA